jgi:hypothetical protein
MNKRIFILICATVGLLLFSVVGFSQQTVGSKAQIHSILDSLGKKGIITYTMQEKPSIRFTHAQAIKYLQEVYKSSEWESSDDPLRSALGDLVYRATHQRFDSVATYLRSYQYDSIGMPWVRFFKWDSLKMKIPVLIPVSYKQPPDSVPRRDTLVTAVRLDSAGHIINDRIPDSLKAYMTVRPESSVKMKDTVLLVAAGNISEVQRFSSRQPFKIYRYPFKSDSIALAVKELMSQISKGDSTEINIRGASGAVIPVWLNSRSDRMERYWLRNDYGDSAIVWIGSTGRDTIGLFLEEGIMFRRPSKQTNISNAQLNLRHVNSGTLQNVAKVYIKPRFWKYRTENNFLLNQTYLTNWASGGQSSLSFALDAFGYGDYRNDKLKLTSTNFIRIKYGLVKPGREKIRKSVDQFEINTKLNHKAFGKFDFSGTLIFKTQLTGTYDYPNDSVYVSNFMNPANLTIGLGLDFKPNKKTSINFAPLSYRGTYLTDTVHYDRKKYGIPAGKHSLHEPGISLQVTNEFSPFKMITITNRLQLFTSYISKPSPNYVIDWEMIATSKLNWFTDVRLNTHLIYDDKILIPLVDKNGKPVLGLNGVQRKAKRTQFKELIGLSFVFRF